jgi:hypothetical protein
MRVTGNDGGRLLPGKPLPRGRSGWAAPGGRRRPAVGHGTTRWHTGCSAEEPWRLWRRARSTVRWAACSGRAACRSCGARAARRAVWWRDGAPGGIGMRDGPRRARPSGRRYPGGTSRPGAPSGLRLALGCRVRRDARPFAATPALWHGAALGLLVWLIGLAALFPLFGIGRPAWRSEPRENAVNLGAHLLFGLSVQIVAEELARQQIGTPLPTSNVTARPIG